MLRRNLWTSAGLTNGSRGILVDVVAEEPDKMPLALLVEFPDFVGPSFVDDAPRVAPLEPVTFHFGFQGAAPRTQFPVTLAWAVTIHKSQGPPSTACPLISASGK